MAADERFEYDCFLSHNSKDKPAVRALAEKLRAAELTVWLDEDEMRPGLSVQDRLESGIRTSRTVAVLIGGDGEGPWQQVEMKAALNLAVNDHRPVIPVLLPSASTQPDLPLFLRDFMWVDLRLTSFPDQQAAFDKLCWGISGIRPNQQNAGEVDRIADIRGRLWDVEDQLPPEDFDALVGRLGRIERSGVDDASEALLKRLEHFLDGKMDRDRFLKTWRPKSPGAATSLDLHTAAADWRDGRIALFLGQDLPSLCGGAIPSTRELPEALVRELSPGYDDFGDTVAEVAELVELNERTSRSDLRQAVDRLAVKDAGTIALYDLIAKAPSPLLILTSAYDAALEDRLRHDHDRRFVVVSPGTRFDGAQDLKLDLDLWPPDPTKRSSQVDPDDLSAEQPLQSGLSLIFRLRGRIFPGNRDSLLITEGDYVQAVKQQDRLLPNYLVAEVSARQLWFLGYDPRRWEDRLLVRMLLERREDSAPKALAVQQGADAFACAFWAKCGVTCLDDIGLPAFVADLERALQ